MRIIKYTILIAVTALILISPGTAPALNLLGIGNNSVYRSSALVEVNIGKQKNEIDRENSWSEVESLIMRLRSRSQIEDIINELNLDREARNRKEKRDLVDKVRKGIKIELSKKGAILGLIRITCEYSEPEACRKIVNILTRQMIRKYLEERDRKLENGIEWLSKEKERYRLKLKESADKLEDFQKDHPTLLLEISDSAPAHTALKKTNMYPLIDRYARYSNEALDLKVELKVLKKSEEGLRGKLKNIPEYIISEKVISADNQELIKQTTALNPIHQKIKETLLELETEITKISDKVILVEAIAKSTLDELKKIPAKKRELAKLQRTYENYSMIYSSLMKKLENHYTDRRFELEERGIRFLIIDNAELPLEPVK